MQQTIQLGQVQPSVLSRIERTVKNRKDELGRIAESWLSSNNKWFSTITGEEVTNLHVIIAHGTALAILTLIGIGGAL